MAQIKVIKSNGERELLSLGKIINALRRSGASDKLAEQIALEIKKIAWSGISTREIYKIAKRKLKQTSPALAARYSLRDAIFKLGPSGFEFEKYIMLLLRAYGYKAYLPEILEGRCITHEVDIIAEKDDKKIMIECKLRHSTNIFIDIKDTMSTWARFMDLRDGAKLGKCPQIDECWLVTNSRFSYDSEKYGECKKMGLLSWNHPQEKPLPAWIDNKKLYPITVLASIKKFHLSAFSLAEILLLQDVIKYNIDQLMQKTRLSKRQLAPILKEAKEVLQFNPNNKVIRK
ncbi:restriction endonuclease [Candidatus Parcubacteria bacterium]|nr:restriction endonuclease [Patescibacteria group bacterium]MCG2693851.1 restriction endonuclease [Candidatus Parcubacteria bacterium]